MSKEKLYFATKEDAGIIGVNLNKASNRLLMTITNPFIYWVWISKLL